jgi:hypothetical protein
MNNPDHISEGLEIIYWVKMLQFFDADSAWKKIGSGVEKVRIRDKHPGSATLHIGTKDMLMENILANV